MKNAVQLTAMEIYANDFDNVSDSYIHILIRAIILQGGARNKRDKEEIK